MEICTIRLSCWLFCPWFYENRVEPTTTTTPKLYIWNIYIYMIYVLKLKLSISQQILHKKAYKHMQNIFFWHLTRVAFYLSRSNMGPTWDEVSSCLSMVGLLSWYFYDVRRALVSQEEDWWRQAARKPTKIQKDATALFYGLCLRLDWEKWLSWNDELKRNVIGQDDRWRW